MTSGGTPNYSRVHSIGECSVCLDIMRDPKTLQCQHSYCKECLEGIVQINESHTFVRCPMCQSEQVLGDGQTVSDLEAQLTLKQLLDCIEEYHSRSRTFIQCCSDAEEKLSPRCLRNENDGHKMEWYCWNCKSFFCKRCLNLHSLLSMCGSKFYEVKYCEAYNSFNLYCGDHKAFHSHGCLWCCDTFCRYCIPEKHSEEKLSEEENKCRVVSLQDYASKFKNPLLEKIGTMKDYTTKQKSVLDEIDNSSLYSQSVIDDFKKYIEERKTVVLSQVLFFLELTGKQMMNSFKSEFVEYKTSKLKMKDEINLKLNSVQDVLKKSENLAGSSLIEIIAQTKEVQDEFHSILPGDIEDHHIFLPAFYNVSDKLTVDDNSIVQLLAGVQASFDDTHISTMKDDGSYEPIEKMLSFSTNVDFSPEMVAQLDNVDESRNYITKYLKKMGVGDASEKENHAEEVIKEEKGKGKNKKKNKNKDTDNNINTNEDSNVLGIPEAQGADTQIGVPSVPPEVTNEVSVIHCELCNVSCSGVTYESHLLGKKHMKKAAAAGIEVKPEVDEAEQCDDSDDSSIAEEVETQSNNRARGRGGGRGRNQRRRREDRRGGNEGAAGHTNGGATFPQRRQSSVDDSCTSMTGNYILEPPNLQHRGGAPPHRGRGEQRGGNIHRSGNMRGRGDMNRGRNMHRGQPHGRGNRGGPNRGHHNEHRGRGAPYQRPSPASSLNNLIQCYKCGEYNHTVANCPRS